MQFSKTLVKAAERAATRQTKAHNTSSPIVLGAADKAIADFESLVRTELGRNTKIRWPGLYPQVEIDGIFHDICS